MRALPLRPNHKRIAAYHASLAEFEKLGVKHETAVRAAFQALLEDCTALVNKGRDDKWKLIPEFSLKTKAGAKITPDGVLLDSFRLVHGIWEAKDTGDDLEKEIRSKFKLGYPRTNILFQAPERAILVQDGEKVLDQDISKPIGLVEILKQFFEYQPPEFDEWERAVAEFKERLPEIGGALTDIIGARKRRTRTLPKRSNESSRFAGNRSIPIFARKLSKRCSCSICSPSESFGAFSARPISCSATTSRRRSRKSSPL